MARNQDTSTFEKCYTLLQQTIRSNSTEEPIDANAYLVECVSYQIELEQKDAGDDFTRWLLILTASMVFFMQVGFAMLCAGCVRRKNVQNTMLKNMLDACGAAVAFYSIGYSFAFGRSGDGKSTSFIGSSNFFNMHEGANDDFDMAFWFFEYTFSAASVTIIAGTLAERCQMAAYICYSLFLTGFVYPIIARAMWSPQGFLSPTNISPLNGVGSLDFAGSGVIHLTGGMTALVSTYVLGPRKGRFHDSQGRLLKKPREFPGHSMALQLMGTMVLWFGWYGFNCGSALLMPNSEYNGRLAAVAAANTSLAGASGALCAMFTNLYLKEKQTGEYSFDLVMAMNGALTGMVSITAGCGFIESWAAICVGMIAGWMYMGGTNLLLKFRLDDAVNAIPVHLTGGTWGIISTGFFASPRHLQMAYGHANHAGWFYSIGRGSLDATLLLNQILAVLFIMAWVVCTMLPFFVFLNYMGWFRTNALEEMVGLDMAYHGKNNATVAAIGDDQVTSEHIEAYQRRKDMVRQRRTGSNSNGKDSSAESINSGDVDGSHDASWNEMSTSALPPKGSIRRNAGNNTNHTGSSSHSGGQVLTLPEIDEGVAEDHV